MYRTMAAEQTPEALPASGTPVPELNSFERAAGEIMQTWSLPGGQLAVAKEGRLVFDRGYGMADREVGEPVQPYHRFRVASVTKTITAVGMMRLVEQGRVSLDDAVFPMLNLPPPPGAVEDPRLALITVRDLLVHAGGWNAEASGDPQYWPMSVAAAAMFEEGEVQTPESIIRFMLGSGLDYDPGSASMYSNFGFNVAGRVIEKVSGRSYGDFIQQEVFGPAGVVDMQLGKTRLADRAENEVRYYAPLGYPATVPSVYPGDGYVPWAYGYFAMEIMDAHGGWIGSASDLLRYAVAIDGQRGTALLQPATIEEMVTAHRPPAQGYNGAANNEPATGLGWVVQPGPTGQEWAHTGALGGSTGSLLLRLDDGTWLAFITNSLPIDFLSFFADLRTKLTSAAVEVTAWPSTDLFGSAR